MNRRKIVGWLAVGAVVALGLLAPQEAEAGRRRRGGYYSQPQQQYTQPQQQSVQPQPQYAQPQYVQQGQAAPASYVVNSAGQVVQASYAAPAGGSGNRTLDLINAQRAAHGLRPLAAASLGAQSHSNSMASSGSMYHASGWIENVGQGQGSPEQIVSDWMNSPGHRANILNPSATTADVGQSGSFWTLRLR